MGQQESIQSWYESLDLVKELGLTLYKNSQSKEGIFVIEKRTKNKKEGFEVVKEVYKNKDIHIVTAFLKGVKYTQTKL